MAARRNLLEGVDADRRDEMTAAFQAGLEQVVEVETDAATNTQDRWAGETPAAVRHLGRDDDHVASLPRFWDQTGVLYRDGQADRLTADPFLATGTMPPLSSTFTDTSKARRTMPAFDPTLCTGCGKCEKACVLEEAAIKVLPTRLAKGELGQHYRWGWKEKQKAGGSLVTPDQQHRYNLPEGERYDYEGQGLIFEENTDKTPFASDPLDTLNRGVEGRR